MIFAKLLTALCNGAPYMVGRSVAAAWAGSLGWDWAGQGDLTATAGRLISGWGTGHYSLNPNLRFYNIS